MAERSSSGGRAIRCRCRRHQACPPFMVVRAPVMPVTGGAQTVFTRLSVCQLPTADPGATRGTGGSVPGRGRAPSNRPADRTAPRGPDRWAPAEPSTASLRRALPGRVAPLPEERGGDVPRGSVPIDLPKVADRRCSPVPSAPYRCRRPRSRPANRSPRPAAPGRFVLARRVLTMRPHRHPRQRIGMIPSVLPRHRGAIPSPPEVLHTVTHRSTTRSPKLS